jgi:hypothetical protein
MEGKVNGIQIVIIPDYMKKMTEKSRLKC